MCCVYLEHTVLMQANSNKTRFAGSSSPNLLHLILCVISPHETGVTTQGDRGKLASSHSPYPLRFSPPSHVSQAKLRSMPKANVRPRFPDPLTPYAPQTFRNVVNKEHAELREVRIRKEGARGGEP